MKVLLVFVVVALVVAAVSAQYCSTHKDCDSWQCCVAYSTGQLMDRGYCRARAKRGEFCSKDDEKMNKHGNKYMNRCPCVPDCQCGAKASAPSKISGLMGAPAFNKCQAKEDKKEDEDKDYDKDKDKEGIGAKAEELTISMTKEAAASAQYCSTDKDCDSCQCCVAYSTAQLMDRGYCRAKAKRGEFCSKEDEKMDKHGNKYMSRCPCVPDFQCGAKASAPSKFSGLLWGPNDRCQAKDAFAPEVSSQKEENDGSYGENIETGDEMSGPGGEKPRDDDCLDWELPC